MSAGAQHSAHPLSGHYMQHGLVARVQRHLHNIFLEKNEIKKEERREGEKTSLDDDATFTLRPPLEQGKQEEVKKADGGRDERKE